MTNKSNLAYDISRYETVRTAETEALERNKKIRSARAAKPSLTPLTLVSVAMVLGIGIMLALFLTSKADIAAVHSEIIDAKAYVEELSQENSRMKAELEQKTSLKTVEEYAENVLGMEKLNTARIEYVSLESGNVVEISEKKSSLAAKIQSIIDRFMEYIGR